MIDALSDCRFYIEQMCLNYDLLKFCRSIFEVWVQNKILTRSGRKLRKPVLLEQEIDSLLGACVHSQWRTERLVQYLSIGCDTDVWAYSDERIEFLQGIQRILQSSQSSNDKIFDLHNFLLPYWKEEFRQVRGLLHCI